MSENLAPEGLGVREDEFWALRKKVSVTCVSTSMSSSALIVAAGGGFSHPPWGNVDRATLTPVVLQAH